MFQHFAQHMTPRTAGFALLLGGAMWGLFWMPVRYLEHLGLEATWAGVFIYTSTLLLMGPAIWSNRRNLRKNWRSLIWSGAFTGAAFGLWTISLFYTEVVRAILLFYLTPVWSTLLGLLFLKERLNPFRIFGILFGIAGLFVVLSGGGGGGGEGGGSEVANFSKIADAPTGIWLQNLGDWLALIAGMAWALGTMGLYRSKGVTITAQLFAFMLGSLFLSLVAVWLLNGGRPPAISADMVFPVFGLAILIGFFVLPMIWLTVWPATLLSPARVGLLLMTEVVVGLASAALFSGEPFGWRESLGAALIVGAAVLELSGPQSTHHVSN
ncbi:MAG: DMT family transporter [Rhizobiaceae bacterium]